MATKAVAERGPSEAEALGFDGGGVAEIQDQVGAVSAIAREESELKAAIVVAKRFPRNEAASAAKLIRSCDRPSFAEGALYRFPRGGATVEGPSVDLAREGARVWGNIRYGLRIVSLDEETVHIKGYALDLETNNYVEVEDKFARLIQRKGKGWIRPDERDLRELVNRRGAICIRNAILQILPPDVIDEAAARVKETIRKAAAGDITQDRPTAIRRLVVAYDALGVSAAMIEEKLGHPLDVMTEEELADLRKVWKSLSDGVARREEFFTVPRARGPETGEVSLGDVKPAETQPAAPKKAGAVSTKPAPKRAPAPSKPIVTAPPAEGEIPLDDAEVSEAVRAGDENLFG